MKKMGEGFKLFGILFVICHLSSGGGSAFGGTFVIGAAQAAYYYPQYWIKGNIKAPEGVKIEGHQIVFYEFSDSYTTKGQAVSATAGAGSYILNAYGPQPPVEPFAKIGNAYKYYVAAVNDNPANPAEGYGANPKPISLSGAGIEVVDLELKKSEGPQPPPVPAPAPSIAGFPPEFDWIKFGDRIYSKATVEKGEQFIVSLTPKISAKLKGITALDTKSIIMTINGEGDPAGKQIVSIEDMNMSNKEFSAQDIGEEKTVTALTFAYNVPEDKPLKAGANTVKFAAKSITGQMTEESATVTVIAGPVQVVPNSLLTFPSPFSPTKDKTVIIQYTLTANADLDIYIFSPTGDTLKKFALASGASGGSAGVNKITWNGAKPSGATIGNAIYSGAIVEHTAGKILAKFKLPVVD